MSRCGWNVRFAVRRKCIGIWSCCGLLVLALLSVLDTKIWTRTGVDIYALLLGANPQQAQYLRCKWNDDRLVLMKNDFGYRRDQYRQLHSSDATTGTSQKESPQFIDNERMGPGIPDVLRTRYNITVPIVVKMLKQRRFFMFRGFGDREPFAFLKLLCKRRSPVNPEYAEIIASAFNAAFLGHDQPRAVGVVINDLDRTISNSQFFRTCTPSCVWNHKDGSAGLVGVLIPFHPNAEHLLWKSKTCEVQQKFTRDTIVEWILDSILSNNDRTCHLNVFYDPVEDRKILLDFDAFGGTRNRENFCRATNFSQILHPSFLDNSDERTPYAQRPTPIKGRNNMFYCKTLLDARRMLSNQTLTDSLRVFSQALKEDDYFRFLSVRPDLAKCLAGNETLVIHSCLVSKGLYNFKNELPDSCLARECFSIEKDMPEIIICHIRALVKKRVTNLIRHMDDTFDSVCRS